MMLHDNPIINDYLRNMTAENLLDQRKAMWRQTIRRSVADERRLMKAIQKELAKRFTRAAELAETGIPMAIDFAMRNMYDDSVLEPLFKAYKDISLEYAKFAYRSVMAQVQGLRKFGVKTKSQKNFGQVWQESLIAYLRLHGARYVTSIDETTRKEIVAILEKAATENWTLGQIQSALTNPKMHQSRAMRIARTETTRALNAGILMAGAAVPYKVQKQWITAEDENVRSSPFSHIQLHNKVIPLDAAFNNGEFIRFPGDPAASASNVINCRCVLSLIPLLDSLGRPVRRAVSPTDTDILNRISAYI